MDSLKRASTQGGDPLTANRLKKNVFMHIFILDLKMVGSKCSKSDWVFVYVFRENYAADKCGKCY